MIPMVSNPATAISKTKYKFCIIMVSEGDPRSEKFRQKKFKQIINFFLILH